MGYWFGNDGSGKQLTDAGSYRNHVILTNADLATIWTPTKRGVEVKYDGVNDYAKGDVASSLDISGNGLTVSAWFNKQGDHLPGFGGPIVWQSHTTDSAGNYGLRHDHSSGQLDWQVYTSSQGNLSVTVTINNNQWYHVVGVYNGINMILYLNGVQIGSPASQTGNLRTGATQGFAFASKANGNSVGFNGFISNVSIHPRSLTADEVAWLYYEPYSMVMAPDPARFFSIPAVGLDELGANFVQGGHFMEYRAGSVRAA